MNQPLTTTSVSAPLLGVPIPYVHAERFILKSAPLRSPPSGVTLRSQEQMYRPSNHPPLKTIKFDNITLTFNKSSVPCLLVHTFTDDIAGLAREWYHSSHLVISGHGVPIWYWDKVYKKKAGIKTGVWGSFCSTWNNWGVSISKHLLNQMSHQCTHKFSLV